jgi:adenylosuccinate synthase
MSNIVVIGAQWGDEGKGKIVDLLSRDIDAVVRFQGGNNAGHTVIAEGKKCSLHLVPSGILHQDKVCMIGNGVVLDPLMFVKELDVLIGQGVDASPDRLKISGKAHVIMPYHRLLDAVREAHRQGAKIGTTGSGIGPCYEDKAARVGVRVADLARPARLRAKIAAALVEKNVLFSLYGLPPMDVDMVFDTVMAAADRIVPHIADVAAELMRLRGRGGRIMFEGAQGIHLDVDHGTYPFVTSSNTVAGNAAAGTGIGPAHLDRVLAIVKAYTTRVGAGPFPTELKDETGDFLPRVGAEVGVTTGRKRRCGWLDLVILRETARLCTPTDIALTKIDVFSGLPTLNVAVAYELDGVRLDYPPQDEEDFARAIPVYETLPGWNGNLAACAAWGDLPAQARAYVEKIENVLGVRVSMVSVGPDRDQTIFR